MKTTLCLLLAFATMTSARAEIFRSGAAARGSGAEVSAHRTAGHHDYGRGYGHYNHGHSGTRVYVGLGYGSPAYYSPGWGYGYDSPYRAWPTYGYYDGYGAGYPYYDYGYGTGSAASSGLVLGALAGGIIGNNSGAFHHIGWRGAAWGAGLGWLLGSVADVNRSRMVYGQPAVTSQPVMVAPAAAQPASAAQPQQITIINNYYNTPMSGANALFGR